MWLWQRKNIHKRHLLWAKLFGLCLFFHLVFLFLIFVLYRNDGYTVALSLNKKRDYSAPIMFVPHGLPTKHTTTTQIKPSVAKPTPQKQVAKPAVTKVKKTTLAIPAKKIEEKKEIKPEVKKPAPAAVAKIETPKPIAELAKAIDIQQAPITPSPPKALEQPLPSTSNLTPVIPENAIISNNYRDVEALRRNAQLQKELIQRWKPPIGVSPECVCEITFFVNKSGAPEKVTITKRSGVTMYDISARQALYAMKMPLWTHEKQIVINFKQ